MLFSTNNYYRFYELNHYNLIEGNLFNLIIPQDY